MRYKQRYKDMPIDKSWTIEKDRERFINEIAEIAFGEDAIERGYDLDEVIEKIQEFSNNALKWEEGEDGNLSLNKQQQNFSRFSCSIKF